MSEKSRKGRRSRFKNVDQRLKGWGLWSECILNYGQAFRSKDILSECSNLGTVVQRSNSFAIEPDNKKAEEIDRLIQALAKKDKTAARVISYHYTHTGTIRKNAASINLPATTYYDRLVRGKKWIKKNIH